MLIGMVLPFDLALACSIRVSLFILPMQSDPDHRPGCRSLESPARALPEHRGGPSSEGSVQALQTPSRPQRSIAEKRCKAVQNEDAKNRIAWSVDGKLDGKPPRASIKRNDFMGLMPPSGSAGRIRTYDQPINSRLLYH